MGRPIKLIGYLCFLMALCSCKETKEQQISRLIHEWEGRTIVYPADLLIPNHYQPIRKDVMCAKVANFIKTGKGF